MFWGSSVIDLGVVVSENPYWSCFLESSVSFSSATLFEKEFRGVVDEGGTNCIAGTIWILDLLIEGAAESGAEDI